MTSRPSKKHHYGEDADLRIAHLETALAQEKMARLHDRTRLEREIDALQSMLQKNKHPDAAYEARLQKRVKKLERELNFATTRLTAAQRQAASYWVEKVAIENRTTYSPFVTHRGAWLAATLVTVAVLVWAASVSL